jgi:hypothetical protein
MDLDKAIQAHRDWKVKLRVAMARRMHLDVAAISADDCCLLGKWLHGEARARYGALSAYRDCLTKHAAFHREAGAVALVINASDHARADRMLDAGTPYAMASSAVGSAILAMKKVTSATA